MSIQVRQMLVSTNKYNIKCPYPMDAQYITLHNTANDASANNEITNMINNNKEVSFHFAVDDFEVVQGIPVNHNAWHCGDGGFGDGNRSSIGIEVCYSKSGGEKYKKAEALAIQFIAQLLHERKWGVERVVPHKHWSGKNCPHRILDEGRLTQVLNAIKNELHKLNTPVPVQKPIPQDVDGYHFVLTGETLYGISRKYNISVDNLKEINNLKSDIINVGDKLKLKKENIVPPIQQPIQPKPQPTQLKPIPVTSKPQHKPESKPSVNPIKKIINKIVKPKINNGKLKYSRILKMNTSGDDVKQLQIALNKLHFICGEPDGNYEEKTKDAVVRFQKVYLPYSVDGIVGEKTINEINKHL